ncbi:MAG: cyclic nucleotide-binding domain-containing protein [Candidatus Sumerlaeaceae bacterium]
MDIFEGLTARQIDIIRFTRSYREVEKGEVVFQEGEPARSLFTIVSGCINIVRQGLDGPACVAALGPGEVFGEMGLLSKAGRTATAEAAESSLLFEIPNDAVLSMNAACGPEATIKLLSNLVLILSDRLGKQNASKVPGPKSWLADSVAVEAQDALATVAKALPKKFLSKQVAKKCLIPGEYLCRKNDPADGFYFIHDGTLQVRDEKAGTSVPSTLDVLDGPAVTGQGAFLKRSPRNASLMAITDVSYTHFTSAEFQKMVEKRPQEALDVLMATAQYLVYWLARG